ncbi:hypothetical protein RI129_004732 [Pyrocoelia pectoralis]|uniref:DDE Tnp4 domain-containing protein n=1 Tax=Pyrocoelia pectoralis TaxID=417401 RepID=A0AAN7ZQU8_9COLE
MSIANLFGIGRTTVGEIVRDFCKVIISKLQNIYICTYPMTQTKLKEIITGFEKLGFPQCAGAIDGCHIEVCPPKESAVDYYNYKGWYSVILLAVSDHRCNFTYVNVGSPGRNNDSHIYETSAIKTEHATNKIYINNSRIINGVSIPVFLIGDSAFKLSSYLIKPYPYRIEQPESEKLFNYQLSKCRRVIENTFGQLKARYRRLLKGLEVHIENVSSIIIACCILNNFCNAHNDDIPQHWLNISENQPTFTTIIGNADIPGNQVRNTIAKYFNEDEVIEEVEGMDVSEANGSDPGASIVASDSD